MAKIRNLTADTLTVPHLNITVGAGEVVDIPDTDVWPAGLAADSPEGLVYAAENPNARTWDVPGVWADVAAPPPVKKPAEPAPTDAPSE